VIVRHPEFTPSWRWSSSGWGFARASQAKTPAEHSGVRTDRPVAGGGGGFRYPLLSVAAPHGSGIAGQPGLDATTLTCGNGRLGRVSCFLSQLAAGFPRSGLDPAAGRAEAWAAHRVARCRRRVARLAERWFRLPEITDQVDHAAALPVTSWP
jgi:hypothetical protein